MAGVSSNQITKLVGDVAGFPIYNNNGHSVICVCSVEDAGPVIVTKELSKKLFGKEDGLKDKVTADGDVE